MAALGGLMVGNAPSAPRLATQARDLAEVGLAALLATLVGAAAVIGADALLRRLAP